MATKERVNILLVDDQPAKLLSLESILADLDENVIKASSADEALRFLLTDECAVVLMDVCMPKMDGFELAELIRGHPRFGRTAIIFISAVYLTDSDLLRGYGLGAVDYIPVPIVPAVLRAKVSVFAELFRKSSDLRRLNDELEQRLRELDRSNERLRVADRMATIGNLAAGLGHDMGNLLLPVRMRLESLAACELPTAVQDDIGAIRQAADYLQRLARSLRLLALDPDVERTEEPSTDVAAWWQETEGLLRNVVGRGIALTVHIDTSLPPVRLEKAALTQVVFNLVQNAYDALKGAERGHITVSAVADSANALVRLQVADNGPGMSEEASRRCLEPFFTTKTRELGTGLGLALVNGIVKRANGRVSMESRQGRGSTFTIELPAATPCGLREGGQRRPAVVRVDILDDRLRAHVRSILTTLGCQVEEEGECDADLFIAEGTGEATRAHVLHRVTVRPEARGILIGGDAPSQEVADRVTWLEPSIKPSALRRRLTELLAAEQAKGESIA